MISLISLKLLHAYCHPSYSPEIFTGCMQDILSDSSVTNKQVDILVDFNLDLLNYDSHISTGDFMSLFLAQHFLPYTPYQGL